MKTRIVQRTLVDGEIIFVIQQRHFLLRWLWVDAWINSLSGATCCDSFYTLDDAKKHLCYFDGSVNIDNVVDEA